MALHDRIRRLTYDDYVLIPDDGQRHTSLLPGLEIPLAEIFE